MNKYQYALGNLKTEYGDMNDIDALQELVDRASEHKPLEELLFDKFKDRVVMGDQYYDEQGLVEFHEKIDFNHFTIEHCWAYGHDSYELKMTEPTNE